MNKLFIVFLGGGIGAIMRYLLRIVKVVLLGLIFIMLKLVENVSSKRNRKFGGGCV